MKPYNVFIKQDSFGKIEDVRLLKDGISITALIFTPFWFLYHRMYKEFFAVILVAATISILATNFSELEAVFLQAALLLMIALNANYWLGENLRSKKDYGFAGMVFGRGNIEAKLNFARNFRVEFEDLNSKAVL